MANADETGPKALSPHLIRCVVEAALMASGKPMDVDQLRELFDESERPTRKLIEQSLRKIADQCENRGFELLRVASGYRFQVRAQYAPWISRMWEEKPQRYSRALLETLALIAYRQPITRGEIEDIRGVAVSTNIMKTLLEREWVRVVGHKDVPGRPSLYATTRQFLDYFNMQTLDQLPLLSEVRDLDEIGREVEARLLAGDALSEPEIAETPHNASDDAPAAGDSLH